MIEAVNSAIANAPLLRGNAEQGGVARNAAIQAKPQASARPLPQAPFVSPFIFMDVNFDTAVIQIRDSETGDVVEQIPSPRRLAAQQRTEVSQNSESVAQQAVTSPAQTQQTAQVQASAVEAQAAAQAFSQAAATSTQSTSGETTTVFA